MLYPTAIRPARMLGALLLSTLVLAGGTIVISQAASAQESAQSVEFSIPAGPLSQALMVWGRQAGVQISYLDAVTSGKSTSGLTGNLRPEQACSAPQMNLVTSPTIRTRANVNRSWRRCSLS